MMVVDINTHKYVRPNRLVARYEISYPNERCHPDRSSAPPLLLKNVFCYLQESALFFYL